MNVFQVDERRRQQTGFRVLVIGAAWPPETFLARLYAGLRTAGVDLWIAASQRPVLDDRGPHSLRWVRTPQWSGSYLGRLVRTTWETGVAAVRSPRDLRVFREHVRSAGDVRTRLRKWSRLTPFAGRRPDVIYFPWNSTAILHLALFDLGIPVILSCRGTQLNVAPHNPKRTVIRDGLRSTFKRAAAVHCVSEAIKREAEQYGLPPEKAWVIRPAVDPHFFRPLDEHRSENGSFRVMTTGSLTWQKGYEYALLALKRLLDLGVPVHYDIVGDGPERQRVLYTIHDLKLQQHVSFHGQQSSEGVRDLLQRADVFLLASLSEGISNAALEAMACGLPVVTTDCGGMTEAVTDGQEGFVTGVRQPDALASALMRLAANPDLRDRMGSAARARVLREFSLTHQVDQWIALFQTLVCKRGKATRRHRLPT